MTDIFSSVAPQDNRDYASKVLDALSRLAPRDTTAVNPATTAAMAKSRDTITSLLNKQMSRLETPFQGMQDVATAGIAALQSRTPPQVTLEALDQNRIGKASQIANTLSQVASREANVGMKGSIDPLRAANLVMRMTEAAARDGDRDSTRVLSHVKMLAGTMEPGDAQRFMTGWGKTVGDYIAANNRNPTAEEQILLLNDYASNGGFRARQTGMTMMFSPFGELIWGNKNTGSAVPVTPGQAPPAGVGMPSRAPAMPSAPVVAEPASPPPGAGAEPTLAPSVVAQNGRNLNALGVQPPAAARLTTAQQGQKAMAEMERSRNSEMFSKTVDSVLADANRVGPAALGPLGILSRLGGSAIEQGASVGLGPDYLQWTKQYTPWLNSVVKAGAESARVQAGIMSIAYMYAKAMDEKGIVSRSDLDRALASLGASYGSIEQFRASVDSLRRDVAAKNSTYGIQAQPQSSGDIPQSSGLPAPRSQAERDRLPKGSAYMAPDGTVRIVP